jgi:hypothetical protein
MRRILVGSLIGMGAMLLGLPAVFAQSGVLSGPPQASKAPSNFASPPSPSDPGGVWIAVSAGFDGKGRNVGVGFSGHQNSRNAAEDAALNACNARGRGIRCREAYAVPTGCLYIVPGSRRNGVTWGRGSTPEVAMQECKRDGYSCDRGRMIGGCTN